MAEKIGSADTGASTPGSGAGVACCAVCSADALRFFMSVGDLRYWRCERCEATLLDSAHRLSPQEARDYYLLHRNDPDDAGYRAFLSRLTVPLLERLGASASGLDFGCGPGPALAPMLAAAGHRVRNYDPAFAPDRAALDQTYDFVACTEVFEHLHHPAGEMALFDRLLRPGGLLAVMTNFQTDDARFANWHYRRDPTHVVFFRARTFEVMAAAIGWRCEFPAANVTFLTKPG